MTDAIAVTGLSLRPPERVLDRSLEEMIAATARETVGDAGLSPADVDGLVLSGCDQIDGRVISAMVAAGPAGAVDRDMTMIPSASEHALGYAYMWLRSGQGRTALVLGWAKPSESVHPDHAELVAAEPFVMRPTGVNTTIAAALQASRLDGDREAHDGPLVAWPLRAGDLPPRDGDAVVGMLLSVDDAVAEGARVAWVRGVGWATDRYDLGDREVAAMPALRAAAARAYGMAGTPAPDVIEVHAPSRPAVQRAADILGRGAQLNPSGGIDRAHPEHAAGLARMAHAADHARSGTRTAVGASTHGFAGQGAAVTVFTSEKEAVQCAT